MKKVLLASDGSQFAEEAAWFLSHLPHNQKLDLIVLTVLQIPYATQRSGSATEISDSLDQERHSATEAFERIEKMFDGANASVRHVIREGHRGQSIVDVANEESVDLAVVGARGRSAVRRLLLGSTSDFVATHAECSVLIVRPTGLREERRPIRIVLGYEESGAAQAALEEFHETHWGKQSDVRVVSVVSYVSAFLNEIVVDTGDAKDAAEDALRVAVETLSDNAPNAQAQLIDSDHVGEGLVEYVEEQRCDLIVVGETPHSLLGRVVLGSVSRFVLRHAPCSVWITRNRAHHHVSKDSVSSV
ncbi:MAG: universal stress protein [Rubripirellula sp.]